VEARRRLARRSVIVGPGSTERQIKAEELAAQHGYVIVPPYNDEQDHRRPGHDGLEILEDLPEVETVYCTCWRRRNDQRGLRPPSKLSQPSIKVIGVEPELAGDAQASLRAGKIVHFPADEFRALSLTDFVHKDRPHQLRAHPALRR